MTPGALPAQRLHAWQEHFAALVAQRMHAPFEWGVHDCCLWAADAVQAITGADVAADVRGQYSTAMQAGKLLQKLGGVAEIACARLGPVVTPALAQVGDVGLTTHEGRDVLAVCGGGHFLAPGPAGLQPVGMAQVRRVWRCTNA